MAKNQLKSLPTLRDKRQAEFADIWLNHGKFGILNLCPRFGKIYTTINILEKLDKDINILIAYPDLKIKGAWESDFEARKYKNQNITYTTHLSLKKHTAGFYDLVILDEVHLLSEAQIEAVKELTCTKVLGLTGTLSSWTEKTLSSELGLVVLAHYPIEQAIEEGVITDYEITVISTPLDNQVQNDYKGKWKTEKKQFDAAEKLRKQQFIREKALKIASIAISTAEAVMKAIATGGGVPAGIPFGVATGVVGAAQLAAVMSTKYEGGTAPSMPDVAAASSVGASATALGGAGTTNAQTTSLADYLPGGSNGPPLSQVVVLESDITGTQQKVQTQQSLSTY